jgi:hypothetical protein
MTYKDKFKTMQEALEEYKRIGGDLSAFAAWLDSVIPDTELPSPVVNIPEWLIPGTWIRIRDVLRRVVNVTRHGNVVAIRTNHGPVTLVKTNEDWSRYPIVPAVVTPWVYEQAIGYLKAHGAIWNDLGEVQLRNVVVERGAWYVTTVSGSTYDPWTLIKFETNKEHPCGNVQ